MAEWVRALAWTGDRTVPAGFESHCGKVRFGTLAIPFTPLCQCLSEETLKAVGPFSIPGEAGLETNARPRRVKFRPGEWFVRPDQPGGRVGILRGFIDHIVHQFQTH